MLTRVALLAASLAASAVMAVGLALFGLAPALPLAWPATTIDPAAATAAATAPITQEDTVYVVPAATPDPTPPPIIIKRVVTVGGGDDGEDGRD